MAVSGTVNYQDMVLYTQYNNLRKDVLDPTYGHSHSGSTDGGKLLTHASMESRTRYFFVPMATPNYYGYGAVSLCGTSSTSGSYLYTETFCFPADWGTPATATIHMRNVTSDDGSVVYTAQLDASYTSGMYVYSDFISGTMYVNSTNMTRGTHVFSDNMENWRTSYADNGELCCFVIARLGTSSYDTNGGSVGIFGVRFAYTADM